MQSSLAADAPSLFSYLGSFLDVGTWIDWDWVEGAADMLPEASEYGLIFALCAGLYFVLRRRQRLRVVDATAADHVVVAPTTDAPQAIPGTGTLVSVGMIAGWVEAVHCETCASV